MPRNIRIHFDNYLIMIEGQDLAVVTINEKRISRVQDLYQENATLEAMVAEGKGKVTRVPLAEIKSIESKHNSDTFFVSSLNFMVEPKRY